MFENIYYPFYGGEMPVVNYLKTGRGTVRCKSCGMHPPQKIKRDETYHYLVPKQILMVKPKVTVKRQ